MEDGSGVNGPAWLQEGPGALGCVRVGTIPIGAHGCHGWDSPGCCHCVAEPEHVLFSSPPSPPCRSQHWGFLLAQDVHEPSPGDG